MSSLLHLSDPHFGTEQAPVVEALVELAAREQPDVVVLSGDITQRARPSQFAAARAFLDRLPKAPRIVIPGNHDIPLYDVATRALAPYRHYRRAFGDDLEPVVRHAGWIVVGLNTTRAHRHKHGEVSARQIRRTAALLQEAPDTAVKVVVTHQPVHVVTERDVKNRVRGYLPAVRAWAVAGADVVLGGHIHLPYVRRVNDTVTDLPRNLWAVQAGTAVSSRIRGDHPNSVNVLRYTARGAGDRMLSVERWDYATSQRRFDRAETVEIALD